MLATVATANIKKVQIKKYSVFIYSEEEPHAMYAIYKQTRTLCIQQYVKNLQGVKEYLKILIKNLKYKKENSLFPF